MGYKGCKHMQAGQQRGGTRDTPRNEDDTWSFSFQQQQTRRASPNQFRQTGTCRGAAPASLGLPGNV
eukprot:1158421-Pelagomonas_calceolata.AAC.16